MTQAELESLLNQLPARATLFIPTEVAEAMAGNRDDGTLMEEIAQKYNCDLDVRQSLVSLEEPEEEGFPLRKRPPLSSSADYSDRTLLSARADRLSSV